MPHNDATQAYLDSKKYIGLTPRPSSLRERIANAFRTEYQAIAYAEVPPISARSMALSALVSVLICSSVLTLFAAPLSALIIGTITSACVTTVFNTATNSIARARSEAMKQFKVDLGTNAEIKDGTSVLARRYENEIVAAEKKMLAEKGITDILIQDRALMQPSELKKSFGARCVIVNGKKVTAVPVFGLK